MNTGVRYRYLICLNSILLLFKRLQAVRPLPYPNIAFCPAFHWDAILDDNILPDFFLTLLDQVVDPGSDCFQSRIQGKKDSRIRIRIKEFKYFNPKKLLLSSRKYDPGCSSRIRILIFYPPRIPDPGVKKAPDPGYRIRIRNNVLDHSIPVHI